MASGERWTETEIEKAIGLYIITPFGRLHQRNPDVIALSKELGRTPGSVALKLSNLASIDDTLDRKGMANASALDRTVWSRCFETLIKSAAGLKSLEETDHHSGLADSTQDSFMIDEAIGVDVFRISSIRQGQRKFRKIISANYEGKCAVSGISRMELLIAGHISPWSSDPENRLNPRNGILLNRLHDSAFENGLISFGDDGQILYSDNLSEFDRSKLAEIESDGSLRQPTKFLPDPQLVSQHREKFGF